MKPHKILTQKELRKRFAQMAMMDAKELGCPFSYFYDNSYSTFARSKSKKKRMGRYDDTSEVQKYLFKNQRYGKKI